MVMNMLTDLNLCTFNKHFLSLLSRFMFPVSSLK